MKLFVFLALAAIIFGGIYHNEVSEYFADISSSSSSGSYGSSGGGSVLGSIRNMGNASSNLLGGVNNSLGQ